MKLAANFANAGGYQQAVFSLPLSSPVDFENVGAISFDVKVDPSSTSRADGDYGWFEIVLRQGGGWVWTALPGARLNGTDWQRVTIPIPKDLDVSSIRAVSLKLGENDFLGPVSLNIDNISYWISPDDVFVIGADNQSTAAGFWEAWSNTGVLSWDPLDVAGRSTSGSLRLDHQFGNLPSSYQQSVFTFPLPAAVNAEQDFEFLNVDVKVDATSTPRAAGDYGYWQLFLRNTSAWTWVGTDPDGIRITDNEWHRYSFKVKAPAGDVRALTFKLGENGFLGPVIMNLDNITWTRRTADIPPPSISISKPAAGLSLVATSPDQYGRHNIHTADDLGAGGELSFVNTTEPVSYSINIKSFPDAATYAGFQTHIFLVPGAPGSATSPDWNEPTLIYFDIKAGAGNTGYATFRSKVGQTGPEGGNSQLYKDGLTTVGSATVTGTWTLTITDNTATMTAPDGTVSDPITLSAELLAAFNTGEPSPLRVYFGVQPNTTGNIGQSIQVGEVTIKKGATVALNDKFSGTELDTTKWVPNAPAGGVQFVSPADVGVMIKWTIPDSGFVLKTSPTLSSPTWTDVTATPITIGTMKQVLIPQSELPPGNEAYFVLIKP